MKILMKLALGILLTGWLTVQAAEAAVAPEWLADLPKALAQAKKDNKTVLVDFTGSDWCPWCIRLHDEVFSKPEFAEYAKKNLVLAVIDFPHGKPQSDEVKKANQALAEKYSIEGFPTILLLNGQGKELGRLEYGPGGPKPFIEKLDALKADRKKS
jgi:thioredoxin-related protein